MINAAINADTPATPAPVSLIPIINPKASNQLHGKQFEDMIKASGMYPGACDHSRSVAAGFDIEAGFDPSYGLPTSIKVSGDNTIELADARKLWTTVATQPFKLLIGFYRQGQTRKSFTEIMEFIFDPSMKKLLLGDLTLEEVTKFHEAISLKEFPQEDYKIARKWAKAHKKELQVRGGLIQLNQKIGSGRQRRLQCSVNVKKLIKHLSPMDNRMAVHELHYGDLALPFSITSGERKFRPTTVSFG